MLLVEQIFTEGTIDKTEKLPAGVLCRVTYPICNIDKINANKRIYERALWEQALQKEDFRIKMKERRLFGHAEHPEGSASNLELTSHVIHNTWIEESAGKVFQTIDVLDTPYGRLVDTLLRAECKVGMSTRAEGELEEAENDTFGKYMRVVPESYNYITTDFTADPSTSGALPIDVKRNLVRAAESLASCSEATEVDKKFAKKLLEECGAKEDETGNYVIKAQAPAIGQTMSEDEGLSWKIFYNDLSTDPPTEVEMGKTFKAETPEEAMDQAQQLLNKESPEGEFEVKRAEEIASKEEQLKNKNEILDVGERQTSDRISDISTSVAKKVDAPINIITKYVANTVGDMGDEATDEEIVATAIDYFKHQNESVSEARAKEIKFIVDMALKHAEFEAALEAAESLEDLWVNTLRENRILIKKVKEGRVSLKEANDKFASKLGSLNRELLEKEETTNRVKSSLTEKKNSVAKTMEILSEAHEKKVREIRSVCDSKVSKLKESQIKEISELNEKHRADMEKQRVLMYAEAKINLSGMKFTPTSRALLEKCESVKAVDNVYEAIIDAARSSALHSDLSGKVVVKVGEKVDHQSEEINRRIGNAFDGMHKQQ